MNDPIGDMLTRIRNASLRGKSTVETPASKGRARVLDVLADEGYIRGYENTTGKDGHPAIEISLKYYDGAPVIREVKRVSKPGRRVFGCERHSCSPSGLGRVDCLHLSGCDVGCQCTRQQCWWRSALHSLLGVRYVSYW